MSQKTQEVEFHVGPFAMAGQIDYPSGDGPHPAVLIIPGPPQHDRYGNVRGYKAYTNYFEPLTETLLSAGYAVFRWDKGGTGKSSSGLAAAENMVSAYRTMCKQDNIDHDNTALLAIGGGSAFVYRKWLELEEINPIKHLCLLSTGVNELKLGDLDIPISLVASQGRILRSRRALHNYNQRTGHETAIFEALEANEYLLDESKGKVNMFNDDTATWHQPSLDFIKDWFSDMKSKSS